MSWVRDPGPQTMILYPPAIDGMYTPLGPRLNPSCIDGNYTAWFSTCYWWNDNHCVMLAFNDKYGPRGNPCVHVAGDIAHYLILLYLQCNTNRTILLLFKSSEGPERIKIEKFKHKFIITIPWLIILSHFHYKFSVDKIGFLLSLSCVQISYF